MSAPAVIGQLLVRQLDHWVPDALHRARRATLVTAYADQGVDDPAGPVVAARAAGRYADRLRGRQLTLVVVAGWAGDVDAVRSAAPAGLTVYGVPGGPDRVPVALKAAAAAGAPVLTYLDASTGPAPDPATLAAVTAGRPGELLLVLGPTARTGYDHRSALAAAGLPLVGDVELVGDGDCLVAYATGLGRSLDAFKDALWAVDAPAGVGYRDPRDPAGPLLEITSEPPTEPLGAALLARLGSVRSAEVAELRRFTVAETIYRAGDADRVLAGLVTTGAVDRVPRDGRLAGDVVITVPSA